MIAPPQDRANVDSRPQTPNSIILTEHNNARNPCSPRIFVLSDDEGLILRCIEPFIDTTVKPQIERQPGEKWMIRGPMKYVVPANVQVIASRKSIPLHEKEGIYVQNTKNGGIKSVIGQPYMLNQDEELWEKPLSDHVRYLLSEFKNVNSHEISDSNTPSATDMEIFTFRNNEQKVTASKIVTLQIPSKTVVQVYNTQTRKFRECFGPNLVLLDPYEEFTQLNLSGGEPKRPNMVHCLLLPLGPDYCSDTINVQTSDLAKFNVKVNYCWYFDTKDLCPTETYKLFSKPDFIGYMCQEIASLIRNTMSEIHFCDFKKSPSMIIKSAVFETVDIHSTKERRFDLNNLVVTDIDVESIEPSDPKTQGLWEKHVTSVMSVDDSDQSDLSDVEINSTEHELSEAETYKSLAALQTQVETLKAKKQKLIDSCPSPRNKSNNLQASRSPKKGLGIISKLRKHYSTKKK